MPKWKISASRTRHIGILLFERFSNHCLANTLEPLRAANDILGRAAYGWQVLTPGGTPVASSSRLPVMPDAALAAGGGGDALILMPSYGFRAATTRGLTSALHRAAGRYGTVIGLDTGAWPMAAAGLLDGRRATIHQAEFDAFAERFTQVDARRDRWVEDGDRITAGGAMAAFDLMLHLIARDHGTALELELEAMFLRRDAPRAAPGGRHVRAALRRMEATLEAPESVAEIARAAGCRQRALEAEFAAAFGASPRAVYRRLRLSRARQLVEAGEIGVAEIAVRCGYADASAFTRAFRHEHGLAPRFLPKGPGA